MDFQISEHLSALIHRFPYHENLMQLLYRLCFWQYEGDDEEVDVEKVDSEMLDIDLNSEVEIEQVWCVWALWWSCLVRAYCLATMLENPVMLLCFSLLFNIPVMFYLEMEPSQILFLLYTIVMVRFFSCITVFLSNWCWILLFSCAWRPFCLPFCVCCLPIMYICCLLRDTKFPQARRTIRWRYKCTNDGINVRSCHSRGCRMPWKQQIPDGTKATNLESDSSL